MSAKQLMLCVLCLAVFVGLAGCGQRAAEQQTVPTPSQTIPALQPAERTRPPEGSAPAVAEGVIVFPLNADNTSIAFTGSKISRILKVVESHVGGFAEFEGTITVQEEDPTTAQIDLTVDMASVFSDNRLLTTTIRDNGWLEASEYPTARFQSTGIEKTESGYTITGDLELHGVTKRISFPATGQMDGAAAVGEAHFALNRLDFGIVEGEGMIQKVAGTLADVQTDIILDLLVEAKAQS